MNYFEFYNLPVKFFLDKNELKKKYIEVSKHHHPDFFTLASTKDQERTLDVSTSNNEAYQTLSNTNSRIAYILKIHGLLEEGEKSSLPQAFLLEMMDINERIVELKSEGTTNEEKIMIEQEIQEIENELRSEAEEVMKAFDRGEDLSENLKTVKHFYLKLKYVSRIKEQLLL